MHKTMVQLSCLIHLLLFCIISSAMAGDVDLLMSFKNSLPNPHILSNWNRKHRVCEFQGVTCQGGHVSSVTIRGLLLGADFSSVSAHILPLRNLETLSLCSTNITGNISSFTSKCSSRLTEINLSSNNLRGFVSGAASVGASCPSLRSLNLSNNYIGPGYNQSSPLVLPHLKLIDLSNNMIANLDLQWLFSKANSLKYLDLSYNNMQGNIQNITNCTSLQHLDLSSNEFSGTLPAGMFLDCIDLTYLNLSCNHFTGKVLHDIKACMGFANISLSNNTCGKIHILPKLQILDLAYNSFSGSLPNSISKLKSLELLDLSANKFVGPILGSLCTYSVSNLKVLYLQDNYFSGIIPDSLRNCTNLVSLDLSLNFLSGSIPSSLGSLSNLRDLMMWQNNLHGKIPVELSSLKSLRNLILDYNSLTGTISDGLANCTSLSWIALASNQLTGSIPIWIGKLDKLMILILRNNSFTGSIPAELGDSKGLLYLDLSSNQLSESIPRALAKQSGKTVANLIEDWPFSTKRISDNNRCHQLDVFLEFNGIRYNDLMMRIPTLQYCNSRGHVALIGHTSQYLINNISLLFLDLSYNQLDGHIPTEFSTMQFLTVLFLEHNQLTGQLPQELGGMKGLLILDLSYNMLEGPIPSSFSTLSLSEVNLSNNRLSGPIPEEGSLLTFPESAFENNSGLCGLPLLPCSSRSMSKANGSQQLSTTDHWYSQIWWIALLLLFCIFFITSFALGQYLL